MTFTVWSQKNIMVSFCFVFGLFAKTFQAAITFSLNGYKIKKAVGRSGVRYYTWSLHNMGINYTASKYRACKHFALHLFASF